MALRRINKVRVLVVIPHSCLTDNTGQANVADCSQSLKLQCPPLAQSWPISTGTHRPTVAPVRTEMTSSTGRRPSWARCVAPCRAPRPLLSHDVIPPRNALYSRLAMRTADVSAGQPLCRWCVLSEHPLPHGLSVQAAEGASSHPLRGAQQVAKAAVRATTCVEQLCCGGVCR